MDSDAARRLVDVLRSPDPDCDAPEPDAPNRFNLPGYEIAGLLGEGAGGQVWRARWERSDRVVALKVLRSRLGEGKHAERAWRELAMLDELRLPCVPTLLDYGVHEGRMYFATEFVEGQNVEEYAASRSLDLRVRVELLARVARAVGELHARGVLHRDLKPSNILITPTGDPVIIDLGVASLVSGDALRTTTTDGAPVGTPAFMAPEQARGDREAIGTWSDAYALGAVGYLLLAGTPPHDLADATLYEAVRRVGQDPPRDPAALQPSLPRPLAAVLRKACAQSPGDRYRSAAELADDLERWTRGEPVEACPPTPYQRLARWVGRHPVAVASILALSMVFLSILTSIAVMWVTLRRPDHIWLSDDGERLVIQTSLDHPIYTWEWDADSQSRFVSAERVRIPNEKGFVWVVSLIDSELGDAGRLIALYRGVHRPKLLGELRHQDAGLEIPQGLLDLQDHRFREQLTTTTAAGRFDVRLLVTDIFKDVPGDEIVAIYQHADLSPTCIRVIRAVDDEPALETLFEIWHDGGIDSVAWFPRDGLLVCTGPANSLWKSNGAPFQPGSDPRYTRCAFAIRPINDAHRGTLLASPDVGESNPVVWMKALVELAWDRIPFDLRIDDAPGSGTTDAIQLAFQAWDRRTGVSCLVGFDGRVVQVVPADSWGIAFPGLKPPQTAEALGLLDVTGYDPATGRLGDWPPPSD